MSNGPKQTTRPAAVTVNTNAPQPTPGAHSPGAHSPGVDLFDAQQAMINAQIAMITSMNQFAMAWATLPLKMAFPASHADDAQRDAADAVAETLTPTTPVAQIAMLASPVVITGIEETVNDQVFRPRPRATQRDIHTLWERSNEFRNSGDHAPRRDRPGRPYAA